MKKTIISHLLLFLVFIINAQEKCPEGYEQRDVKCSGKIVSRCVPINFTCNKCWAVDFAPCPGTTSGGIDYYGSYERALNAAENASNNWHDGKCTWWDNTKYEIYLDDSKYCSTTPNATNAVKTDLRNKIMPFLKRYKSEIDNFKRYFAGQPYKPGAIFDEYESVVDLGEENTSKLESLLLNINDNNIAEIERNFEDLKVEEANFTQKEATIKSEISAARQKAIEDKRKESNDSIARANKQASAASSIQYQATGNSDLHLQKEFADYQNNVIQQMQQTTEMGNQLGKALGDLFFPKNNNSASSSTSYDFGDAREANKYFKKGVEYEEKKEYDKAIKYYEKARMDCRNECCSRLGNIYLNGLGVKKDGNKAISYFQDCYKYDMYACYEKSWQATRICGLIEENGLGEIPIDLNKALEYYNTAKQLPDADVDADIERVKNKINGGGGQTEGSVSNSVLTAGQINDKGVDSYNANKYIEAKSNWKVYVEAKSRWEAASNLGSAEASANLGALYECGLGVQQDYKKALEYYIKAKKGGYADADKSIERVKGLISSRENKSLIDVNNSKKTEVDYYKSALDAFNAKDYVLTMKISKDYIKDYPDKPQGYIFNVKAAKGIDTSATLGTAIEPMTLQNEYLNKRILIFSKDAVANKNALETNTSTIYRNLCYMMGYFNDVLKDVPKAIDCCDKIIALYPNATSDQNKFATHIKELLKKK